MQLKICGIKDIEDGEASVQNGADYLGFNFIKSSERVISPENSLNIINYLRKNSKLDLVQICGDGDIDTPVPSMKQIRIKSDDNDEIIIKKIQDSLMKHNYVILDTYKKGKLGGTGEKFNWSNFKNSINTTNVFSSGGINHENISALLNKFRPFGIDIASGVETEGKKDPSKIKKVIELSKKN